MITRFAVPFAIAVARLAELAHSRRNIANAEETAEGPWSRRTYPLMVALHVATIGGTLLFGQRRSIQPWLLLLLAVQPIRAWILLTLGKRWNTRGAVDPGLEIATGGPYRYVRHPNYAVVAVELFALPMAFRLRCLAVMATLVNMALMFVRIPEEEALLGEIPGYDEHFANLPRFFPQLR